MREYFVDAWLIIAALDRDDQHHLAARRIGSALASDALVTHEGVFIEVLASFSSDGPRSRQAAVDAVRNARRRWTVMRVDGGLFDRGLDRYERRPDKEYSLVDCMSMVLMEDRGIRHVLTNDHHFTQAGFIVVNR